MDTLEGGQWKIGSAHFQPLQESIRKKEKSVLYYQKILGVQSNAQVRALYQPRLRIRLNKGIWFADLPSVYGLKHAHPWKLS